MTLRIYCPSCSSELRTDSDICPTCGAGLHEAATQRLEPPKRGTPSKQTGSYPSIDNARFIPGTILVDRYRIVGLLGKGGMGEVYRAEDLKLGQVVALKFLPEHLLSDGASLARFHREVRTARHVSHKNVCRVYDIGETNGHHFLSMEYIKGEELSSLLRRIGRLPSNKAVQLARQICAGLAAAHDNGVLHRDLKPSNIMIDGEGNARILDFGLAGLAEDFRDDEKHAGTPAYMAPEQLAGKSVSDRSDIYSLGLVLYELFTGKRAYEANTLGELMKLRLSDTTPTSPSDLVKDLDPVIERIIERCIEKEPTRRPSSALHVAAALPGGDPIAAALAAGETPSPEMVAAAPKEGALDRKKAVALFAALLMGVAFVVANAHRLVIDGFIPLEKSNDVLREHARDHIRKAGYAAPATDYMEDFALNRITLEYLANTDKRPDRWSDLKDGQPAVVSYWYRQSPSYLEGFDFFRDSWSNPPPIISGMAGVELDTRGRLLSFYAVPPQIDSNEASAQEMRTPNVEAAANPGPADNVFASLFVAAGLDLQKFEKTTSQWAPLYMNDTRIAWQGVYPEQPTIPIRIEAASYKGKPVQFDIVNPWDRPERQLPPTFAGRQGPLFTLLISVFVLVLAGSVLLAFRNIRLGRGDRKGAMRLGVFAFGFALVTRLFSAHHVPTFAEFGTLLNGLQDALFAGAFFYVVYLALEPFVRKRWPHRIISWSRLLAGDFRDPMVGRDILIGAVFGIGIAVWQISFHVLRELLGDPTLRPAWEVGSKNLGMANFVGALSNQVSTPLLNSFQFFFVVLLLALIFRRDWLGFVVGWILFLSALALLWGGQPPHWISAAITAGLLTAAFYRFGLLTGLFAIFYLHLYINFPVTTNFTAWYATGFVIDLFLLLTIATYAFFSSLAGQSVLSRKLLED